jgi:hypothetical protein
MALRIPCLIAATLLYQVPWLAAGILVLSIPLPWMAVLIANDRPPKTRERFRPFHRAPDGEPLDARRTRALPPAPVTGSH